MKIHEICNHLESFAPLGIQEPYDNSGLLVGHPNTEVQAALITLDCTEEVVEEAIEKQCQLIIAHHPIIFKGLKSLTGKNYVERTVIKAIQHNIALYAIHTNLDNTLGGVNFKIAEKLNLQDVEILLPKNDQLMKLTVFVPTAHTGPLLDALYAAGAGEIGNYSQCSFRTEGKGTFKPNEAATPRIGQRNRYEEVDEHRIEVIFPFHRKNAVLAGMREGHVYEEIAYYLTPLSNRFQEVGSGAVGHLPEAMNGQDFLAFLKQALNVEVIKHTEIPDKEIKRIALCGGSGSFLLSAAKRSKAEVYISSDFKYHEYFDAEGEIMIADVGHFESEQFTKELIRDVLLKKFTNFASYLSEVKTNPVSYYY
ncbi:Nif3-like dinuclear metal center hexameric protein [Marinilongibacter aquaticus]|uniref:Nif3-like dinuclear metal center hexameric protein n=1 Tax=Marinilongibacter aquaticus TaxID=2975157 RepID=UPI0021BD1AF9|nr:Nif3-like dinuclear metal center hexameric protein [Marinilongibacter aquaticus]UBM57170.1 Nif3-like dinuclear metal center hexameric protein [Marinilongibacter aquaticus]